jgi:hypothetical protein
MNTQLICRNVKRKALKSSLLTAGWQSLCTTAQIEDAVIRAEYRPLGSPPFRVWADVSISGPVLQAMGQGLTLDAATLLAVRMVERGIKQRWHHRELNQQNRLQTPKATRDRFLQVNLATPHPKLRAAHTRTEKLKFVYG